MWGFKQSDKLKFVTGTGIDLHFRPGMGENTGVSHLIGSIPACIKKQDTQMGVLFLWSRVRESNPPSRLGKPLYYRYTNPACVGIIAKQEKKSNHFLSKRIFPCSPPFFVLY